MYKGSIESYRSRKGLLSENTRGVIVEVAEFLGNLAMLSFVFLVVLAWMVALS